MKISGAWKSLLLLTGFYAIPLLNCSSTTTNGPTIQTGNGMVAGIVFKPDGITPASNAFVYMRKKGTIADISGIPVSHADTSAIARTDSDGEFTIDSIDTGAYIIECTDGGNNIAFIDSVLVRYFDSTVVVPPATLKPAGAIKGIIRLSEGGDPQKVFVIAVEYDRFTTVENDGSFKFERLAEGTYSIKILPTLDGYGVFDTTDVHVPSADTTILDTIDLPFMGLPTVRDVSISYDTLLQRVTLRWSRPASVMVRSFNIYRRAIDPVTAIFAQLNFFPVIDTIFIDSFCEQNRTYEYRVVAVDSLAKEGDRGAPIQARIALYDLPPKSPTMTYDTIRQTVTLKWGNPDTALVTGYNVYRRNVLRGETFWTPFNNGPIRDTFFIDSTFKLCPTDDGSCDDSTDGNTPTYEYCIAALIHDMREGVRSAGLPLRICATHLTPGNLDYTYDTLQQRVRLQWNRPDMTIVSGFVIFRRSISSNEIALSQISNIIASDTFYIDSTGEQNQSYEYRVASVVNNDRAVVKSSGVDVRIAASFVEDTVFTIRGSGLEQLDFPNDIAIAPNGDIHIVDQGNRRIQIFDSTMRYKTHMGDGILDYPLKISVDGQGNVFVGNYDSNRDCSSIFRFDCNGTVLDTVLDSTIINDLDIGNGLLYTITGGRTISIHSLDGGTKKSWQISGQNAGWIVAGDTNSIFAGAGLLIPDRNKVVVYDSLGNGISSMTLPYFAGAAAYADRTKLLYVVGADGRGASMLHVLDQTGVETARYKIRSDDRNISIGVQENGAVFIVFKNEGKILKLKPSR